MHQKSIRKSSSIKIKNTKHKKGTNLYPNIQVAQKKASSPSPSSVCLLFHCSLAVLSNSNLGCFTKQRKEKGERGV